MAYIYQIVNDINQKIYIGKTEFSIEKRFKEHCKDAFKERDEKRPLYAAMRKYGIEHFHIELVEETDSPEEREIYWIDQKQSYKHGYNATLGGDGRKHIDYDEVVKTYLLLKSVNQTAKTLKIDAGHCGKILKEKGIKVDSPQIAVSNKFSKKVKQLSKEGIFIQQFSSVTEAAKFLSDNDLAHGPLNGIISHIASVCSGKRKTAYKYVWQYF